MIQPYLEMVQGCADILRKGRELPLGGFAARTRPPLQANAPKALVFSPHPDDECIVGGLALRLLQEQGFRVIDVAVTQGSDKDRQGPRLRELEGACGYLGFELQTTQPGGLEKISPKGRESDPANWRAAVAILAGILRREQPEVVFMPHDADLNGTHVGTHHLVVEAMTALGTGFSTLVVENEYWAAMDTPNLMVELSVQDVANLVAALSFHAGEVRRNPYHLTLPAWMQDNVRRGGELVGGQGHAAPDYLFATLYRLRRWADGGFRTALAKGVNIGLADSADLGALAALAFPR